MAKEHDNVFFLIVSMPRRGVLDRGRDAQVRRQSAAGGIISNGFAWRSQGGRIGSASNRQT